MIALDRLKLKKEHAELAMAGMGLYNAGVALWSQYRWWRTERGYRVTIPSTDPAFNAVGSAVLPLLTSERRRRLLARSERTGRGTTEVVASYEATKPETVMIEGYKVRVGLEKGDGPARGGDEPGGMGALMRLMQPDRLVLWTTNEQARDAVMRFVGEAVANEGRSRTGPRLWVASRWGEWINMADAQGRPLGTVVLPGGQRESLMSDLQMFLDQEREYVRLGLPWHRGYLLYGPPGTGKTSLVRAVASHMGLDLYCVSVGDVQGDSQLNTLLHSVGPRSALLLEDLDTATVARDRDADKPGVSTSGLLQALDGVGTPHGLVTFMTTNRRETIDPALVRPGRCDRQFELGYLDDDQLRRLVQAMVGHAPELPPIKGDLTPAEVVELLKENIAEPERFLELLRERLVDG